jgi:ketosteroid isomerase-like protein
MRTLTPDIVLLPSGMTEIRGHDAAKAFWFPASGAATTIDAMTQTVDEVLLASDLAVVRGRGTLTFTTGAGTTAQTRSQASWFVNVLRREQDGSWKIARRMWSDVRR